MMSVDQNVTAAAVDKTKDMPVPDDDVEILVRVGIQLLKQGGLDIIKKAINSSSDPAQVIGQFMAQLILKMGEEFVEKMQLDPRAFLAKGGFLEELLDYLEQQLGLPSDFSDKIYSETVEVIKAVVLSRGARPGQGQPQQAEQGPPQPQQGQPIEQMGGM